MRRQRRSCARRGDPAKAAPRTRSQPKAWLRSLWGRRHLAFELGGERHRAGAATGAAHGDENVLLLLLVEVGAIEQLSGLLFEQRVQREGAIRNLILRRGLRSGVGLPPCRRAAPDLTALLLALCHSCLRRLANGHSGCRPICPMIFPMPRVARAWAHDTIPTYRVIELERFSFAFEREGAWRRDAFSAVTWRYVAGAARGAWD